MMYDRAFFDEGIERDGTHSIKWDRPPQRLSGSIPLWVADMDFRCADPLAQALKARADHACYGYTHSDGGCYTALCHFWARRHGISIGCHQILPLPSVVSGLSACVEVLSQPGEGVIIQPPVYGPFFAAIRRSGRALFEAPLVRDFSGVYSMDLGTIEGFLKQGARLMLLCNPHNPVSRLWTAHELAALKHLLERYGAVLVSDEIHADFAYPPYSFVSALPPDPSGSNVVCLASASKSFNVAGLKQAFLLCGNAAILKAFSQHMERYGMESENLFALEACRAAFSLCDDWLDALLSYLDKNRSLVSETLRHLLPGAVLTPIEATFLAWVDIRSYGKKNSEAYRDCLSRGVIPSEGDAFGKDVGEGFMRLNFACPAHQLVEGLERFASAIKQ